MPLLYAVEPRVLIQAVKRNRDRFPDDFMFQLTEQEFDHFEITNCDFKLGSRRRTYPYAFTEQGVTMLSSVFRSERAIEVNIAIMRTFVRLREMIASNKGLARRLTELEKKYDGQFRVVFEAIRELMTEPPSRFRRIGFKT